jgi:tRNA (cytidine/uridine-2'-O-)-methyltransferase
MSFHVVLVEPEIPPNTGNVIRLCANTGCTLHLVHPLGFDLSEKQLRRAGMDYRDIATIRQHADWAACREALAAASAGTHYALSTRGRRRPASAEFRAGDVFVFGCETRGLAPQVLADIRADNLLRLPMVPVPGNRSLNLSNSVAVVVYEAWRQIGYAGGE